MNLFLVITCALSISNCKLPDAPLGSYGGQSVIVSYTTLPACEAMIRTLDEDNAAKHWTKGPTHSVCVEEMVDNRGGFDVPDADDGGNLWVPVISLTVVDASAGDGPPTGLIAPIAYTNNATCLANLPKAVQGTMYPVCAKVQLYRAR